MKTSINLIFFYLFEICLQNDYFYNLISPFSELDLKQKTVNDLSFEASVCNCDITPGVCDYRCCCDLEFPVDLLTSWILTTTNICKDKQDVQKNSFTYCFDKDYLIQFNLKRGMRDYTENNLFCVSFDNSSKKTLLYNPPKKLTEQDLIQMINSILNEQDKKGIYYKKDRRDEFIKKEYTNYLVDDYIFHLDRIDENKYSEAKFKFRIVKLRF